MLTAAALVPPTPLLVPGAAGRATVLQPERDAALAAAGGLVASAPELVVVLTATGPWLDGPARPSLGAAGIPDADLGWPGATSGPVVTHVPSAVGLRLLARVGWRGPTALRAAAGAEAGGRNGVGSRRARGRPDGTALADRGSALVADRPAALLVVAGGSVRRGEAAPLAPDPRAAEADEAFLRWLRNGCPGDVPIDAGTAEELGADLWAPAQVLGGALADARRAGDRIAADVALTDPFGAAYLVGSWMVDRSGDVGP